MYLVTPIFIALIGLIAGSFLNVLILRIPERRSIGGRSFCPSCKRALLWWELIPVISYIALRGRCRTCRARISLQYPLVELATAALFVFAWVSRSGNMLFAIRNMLFLSFLLVLFVQDLRWSILPDHITLPALAIAVAFWFATGTSQLAISNWLLATVIGALFFLLQWLLSRGRWVGGGDIRLGAVMGSMLGWPGVAIALFIAYIGGAAILIPLLATGRVSRKQQVPFGVFLIPATVITMYAGDWFSMHFYRFIGA